MDIRWLNEASQAFLSRDYLLPGQTVANRIQVIGDAAEKILKEQCTNQEDVSYLDGYSQKLQSYIARGWISLSTPIWANFGTDRGLPISCFGSFINDSVESILDTVAEIGTMSKYGGGTSAYFGNIRGRGSLVKNNGISNGTKPFVELFQATSNVMNQGSVRRGYFSAYNDIYHPDIEEWLNFRGEGDPIQHITWGVNVPTWWIDQMRAGDADKRKIWARVIQKRFETGLPYIYFTDNANNGESTPECYRGKGLMKASQMCVVGSDKVVTSNGIFTVKDLYLHQDNLTLFDNNKVVDASKMKLIEKDAKVYTITLGNGMKHTITDYHKLKVNRNYGKYEMVECKNLKIGDKICVQTNKGLFGAFNKEDEAYLLGLYQGDGTQDNRYIHFDVWEKDFDLLQNIEDKVSLLAMKYGSTFEERPRIFNDCTVNQSKVKKKRLSSIFIKKVLDFKKGVIPNWIWEGTEKTQWEYIKGLLQTDGTVSIVDKKQNSIQLSISNINKNFLQDLQLIFNNLGLNSKLKLNRKAGLSNLPNGLGGHDNYNTKDLWRLYITNKPDCLKIERNTGFLSRKGMKLENGDYKDNIKKSYKIISIEYSGKEDVYCTTVNSKEHLWICNGFITSNCTEIMLPSNKDNSFVCDLASANDLYFDEYKDTDCIEVITFLLDAAMSEFTTKASKIKHLERAVRFAIGHRALGIGRLGYHSLLQSKMIAFESLQARNINIEIQQSILEKATEASKKLAQMFGECEWTKGTGRRNTTLIALAPTTSSAFIMQVSQEIEAWQSNYFIKDLAKGKFVIKNTYLEKLLEEKGKNTDEVWDSIKASHGSVLHLDFLTNEEKFVFKTAKEISQEEVIIQAAQRQKFIDQGQSLNLFISADKTAKEVNALMLKAHDMGIKSLYYQHNSSAVGNLTKDLTCVSCE